MKLSAHVSLVFLVGSLLASAREVHRLRGSQPKHIEASRAIADAITQQRKMLSSEDKFASATGAARAAIQSVERAAYESTTEAPEQAVPEVQVQVQQQTEESSTPAATVDAPVEGTAVEQEDKAEDVPAVATAEEEEGDSHHPATIDASVGEQQPAAEKEEAVEEDKEKEEDSSSDSNSSSSTTTTTDSDGTTTTTSSSTSSDGTTTTTTVISSSSNSQGWATPTDEENGEPILDWLTEPVGMVPLPPPIVGGVDASPFNMDHTPLLDLEALVPLMAALSEEVAKEEAAMEEKWMTMARPAEDEDEDEEDEEDEEDAPLLMREGDNSNDRQVIRPFLIVEEIKPVAIIFPEEQGDEDEDEEEVVQPAPLAVVSHESKQEEDKNSEDTADSFTLVKPHDAAEDGQAEEQKPEKEAVKDSTPEDEDEEDEDEDEDEDEEEKEDNLLNNRSRSTALEW